MKNIIIALLICLFVSCGKKQNPSVYKELVTTDTVPKAVSHINVEKVLYDWKETVENCSKKDSVFYPLGNTFMEEDTSRIIAIGRFIDGHKLSAIDISNMDNPMVTFYVNKQNRWEIMGQYQRTSDVDYVEFRDYDGDNRKEIVTIGHGNMNGNYFNEFYSYSETEDKVKFAGSIFAGVYPFEVDTKNKLLKVEYGGSWYADMEKTIYQWQDGKLVQLKQVVIGLKNADGKHHAQFIEYYENPFKDKDSLVLKYRKTFREKNKKQSDFWEHFFDNLNDEN